MTVRPSSPEIAPGSTALTRRESSLVRRLVRAKDDPGKERVRGWLSAIDDARLLSFGLTPDDISLLRAAQHSK